MRHGAPMLAAALLAGVGMAWSPRYWSAGIAIAGICLVAAMWAIFSQGFAGGPRPIPLWLAVAAICGWGTLQLVANSSVAPWLTLRASMVWLACGLSFFLASQLTNVGEGRRAFLAWLLWGTTAVAIAALLQRDQGITGTFLYKNHFAALIEMVAPIALYRGLTSSWDRLGGGAAFVLMFAAVVASACRAGVILLLAELFIAIIVMLWRRALRPKTALFLTAVSITVLCAGASIAGPERIWEHFQEKNPWSVRRQLFASTIQMTRQRPWLGSGLGTWRAVYPGFATFDVGLLANEAHSDWAEWTAEGGVLFAIPMALLTIWLAKPAVQSVWGLGVLMAMVHSLVDYPIRDPATGLMWFALAGTLSSWWKDPFRGPAGRQS